VDDTINLEDLFKMANEVAEQENDSALYPLYWALGSENDAEEQEWNLESLATLKKQYPNVLRYYDVERTTPFHYFAKFQTDNYVSNNDTQIVDYLPEEKTQTTVIKRTVKQGAFVSATNGLTGVASWSEHKAEAMDFLMLANTDADIATILQFGQENTDYKRENGRIADCDQLINYFSIGNKWITPPFGLEPDNKEEAYRSYLQEHLESSWEG
jgi:hypothetical protein